MIKDINIEKALDFIRDNAEALAEAKANRIYLEQYRKSLKAILVLQTDGTIQARDAYAYSHKDYIELLEGLKVAVEEEERLKWLMVSAQAKVEIYRTQQSNRRALGVNVL